MASKCALSTAGWASADPPNRSARHEPPSITGGSHARTAHIWGGVTSGGGDRGPGPCPGGAVRPATSGAWRPRRPARVPPSPKAPSERRTGPTSSGPPSTRSWSRPTPDHRAGLVRGDSCRTHPRLCALHRCVQGSLRNLRRGLASAVRTEGPSTRTRHPMGHARPRGPGLAPCASEGRCGIRIVDRLYWSLQ